MSLDPSLNTRLHDVFERQRARRRAMAKRSSTERIQTLRRLRTAIVERREALAGAIFQDFHKPPAEVELSEIHPTLEEIDHAIANLDDWMAPKPVSGTPLLAGTRSELRYEPKGVSLILAPWNYPFNLAVGPLVGAIAAGNCVILKPSEKTPATARFLSDLAREVFDECEVAILEGDAELAQALLDLPFVHVFFTGSTRIGRLVMAAAAKNLASVTLELGGKSPVIVDRSADLEAAARAVAWGRLLNAGQTCLAPDHVWVHESVEARAPEPSARSGRRPLRSLRGGAPAKSRPGPGHRRPELHPAQGPRRANRGARSDRSRSAAASMPRPAMLRRPFFPV